MMTCMRYSQVITTVLVATLASALAPEIVNGQSGSGSLAYLLPPKPEVKPPPPSSPEAIALWHDFYADRALTYRKDSLVVRDAYLGILERWAEVPSLDEPQLLSYFEGRLFHNDICYSPEQFETLTKIASQGAVLPAAMLHLNTWSYNLGYKRFSLVEANALRLEDLMKVHVAETGRSPEAISEAADFLTHLGERIWDTGYYNLLDLADSALDRAVDYDPNHVAARYLRLMISEKRGFYRPTVRDLEYLHRLKPLQGDITLRLAINLARRGKEERAIELLDALIARSTRIEDWVHSVALQEAVRLAMDHEQWRKASDLLAQARSDYPENPRFALMEIDLERRATHRPTELSRTLLDTWSSDFGETPRLRYLRGPLPELEANRNRVSKATNHRAPALRAGARRLMAGEQGGSLRCSGLWKKLLPQGDPPRIADNSTGKPSTDPSKPSHATYEQRVKDPISPSADETPSRLAMKRSGANARQVYYDDAGRPIRIDETVDLELTELYVTPKRLGRKNLKLRASDLDVFDEGRKQEIVTFEQGDVPFTATLLIDASGSMFGPRMASALAGAQAFIQDMAPFDRARLVIAADRLRGVSSFVSADDAGLHDLTERLHRTSVGGGTALFDFLFLSIDALQPEHGRKVVIVLSDGFDMMSVVPMESVREAIRRSQIQLYWVRLREGKTKTKEKDLLPATNWRPIGESQKQLSMLERTVRESGGDVVDITSTEQVAGAFAQILQDLRNQIAIGYYADTSRGDGRWRKVDVKARKPGVRLRHVNGYFDG